MKYQPRTIKLQTIPHDQEPIEPLLNALALKGFILIYEVESCKYLQVVNFSKHQNPHKNEQPSMIPVQAPEEHGTSTRVLAPNSVALGLIPDSLSLDSGFLIAENPTPVQAPPPVFTHMDGNATVTEIEDGWGAFTEAWSGAGLIGPSGPDWQKALDWWRHRIDLPNRLGAVQHLGSVDESSPVAKMLPLGYLQSQAWTRRPATPRAPAARAGPNRVQQANDERTARVIAKLEAEQR